MHSLHDKILQLDRSKLRLVCNQNKGRSFSSIQNLQKPEGMKSALCQFA